MSIAASREARTLKPENFRLNNFHIVLSTVAVNLLSLALPVMTLQIYDRILPNPDSGTLPVLTLGVAVAIVLEACLRLARAWMIGWSGASYEYGMSTAAMRHVLGSDISRMQGHGVGEHLHRMSALGKMKDFFNGYALGSFVDLLFVPFYMGFIVYVAGPLAGVPAALLMLFTLVSLAEGQRLRRMLKKRDAADDSRYNFLIESLDGIHTLKAFSQENIFCRKYEALEEKSAAANYETAEATARAFNAGTVMSHAMVACVIAAGAVFVLQGQVTAGALIATLLLSGRMMQMIQRGLVLWVKYQDYLLARDKARSIFDTPQAKHAAGDAPQAALGSLSVKNLRFHYKKEDGDCLSDVSFDMGAGEAIAIAGENASGKTTLMNLIAGIYPPRSGTIEVDGVNILNYRPEDLARHVGYIASEPVIFRGTIRDNITRFGLSDDKAARAAAARLGIEADVARLPMGFDTVLQGNASDTVPPGLKQRIAIARVLAAKPRVILFDEADAALDPEGYSLVYTLLQGMKETCALVLATEDPNIAGLADRHYVLARGMLSPGKPPPRKAPAFIMPDKRKSS